MEIKMFAKTNNELVVTGFDREDIYEYMLNSGMFCRLNKDEDLIIQCDNIEDAKGKVIYLIAHNHDIKNIKEERICYYTVYTFECFE